jgi:flavin-dependent dehydrogenase
MNQLPMFDVAVIGGGLAGLTAAVVAGRAGRSVVVFEKGTSARRARGRRRARMVISLIKVQHAPLSRRRGN